MKLTVRNEQYAQLLFKGMSQYDAYMTVYQPHYARYAVDINASQLANSAKLKLRLAELRNCVTAQSIATVTERQERLTTFIREDLTSPRTGNPARMSNIAAVQELNKMTHVYEEQIAPNINIAFVIGKGYRELPKLKDRDDAAE